MIVELTKKDVIHLLRGTCNLDYETIFKLKNMGLGTYIGGFVDIFQWSSPNSLCWDKFSEKQAKSALAMAQISQIMANDERFGGVVTDEEYANNYIWKYAIHRKDNKIERYQGTYGIDHFLSFHTQKQRDLFLKENEDLVKDYLMI